ncbi:MAG: RrF2 family transcriptional regulator [Sphingobacteriales bacterium]
MAFSKSFSYALRSILYLTITSEKKTRLPIQEIADNLDIPRHFLGKIMKQMAKEGIIDSAKGPLGGFSINEKTTSTPLIKIIQLTDGTDQFKDCALSLGKCNSANPCPLHSRIECNRRDLLEIFTGTTVNDLIKTDAKDFVNYI